MLNSTVSNLPPAQATIAYGSGLMSQGTSTNMLDLLLVVEDTKTWHRSNLERNPHHYALPAKMGETMINFLQEMGPGLFYNTAVTCPRGTLIKYGVVSTNRFVDDLVNWSHIYAAGRLHKPHMCLSESSVIQKAIQSNLENAVNLAMLLNVDRFSLRELYLFVTELSYFGDIRMGIGEHPKKITNIVDNALPHFSRFYGPTLERAISNSYCSFDRDSDSMLSKSLTEEQTSFLLSQLPSNIRTPVFCELSDTSLEESMAFSSVASNWHEFVKPSIYSKPIRKCINRTVRTSSIVQSAKGPFTAGMFKAVVYLARKVGKAWH